MPVTDFDAVVALAASRCAEQVAEFFSQTGQSTLGSDFVTFQTKAQEYRSQATVFKQRYKDKMGLKEIADRKPAMRFADQDYRLKGRRGLLTHNNWRR